MTSEREITPPPSFSAVPTTTTMFSATTPENTPLAYRASTSTNPSPMISPTFVEANYETLESLLRDRQRKMRNNDLQTELEYFTQDYDEEREMESRPEPVIAITPPLRAASPRDTLGNISNVVDKVFSKQIRRNLEAYVDDMVIKSTSKEGMLSDIQETFERFWSINMKLNPKKCLFGVEEGLFSGHLITKQGIKANPTKIKAVTELEQPRALKDIQSLNGKLAALSCFLSKGAKRSLPFFKGVTKGHTQLPCTVKAYIGIGACSKKASKILSSSHDNGSHSEKKVKEKELSDPNNEWKLYTDGASSSDSAGARLMLIDPAEYKALLAGLYIAQEIEITKVAIFLDSQLMVNQIKGTYIKKQLSVKSYLQKVKTALKRFEGYTVDHV
ncbi:reverse transcriptase domain-containing protein [Tanacetum coccineum]|uniref:Reverse transcriptase domain-containing protein n=1 Tax=Tanacetum coccineum TaxID=301880 RepID=A0ABQ5DIZ5_9ASTR